MSFRTVVESEAFAHEKLQVEPDVQRLDEMLSAVHWALARHPEHFALVPGTQRLRVVATDPFPGAPSVRIWYTFGPTEVLLLSIEKCESDPSDDSG
jgi:hypothetical protein